MDTSDSPIECGKEANQHFDFDPAYRSLNHGSYGCFPVAVRDAQRHQQELADRRPDPYIIYEFPSLLLESRRVIAQYVNAPFESCVFVPNATTGVNTVLRNIRFKTNDVIIFFTNIYGACAKTIAYLEETTPVIGACIDLTYPLSDDDICAAFESKITSLRNQSYNPVVAIYDTISSMPGVRMPFERLTSLCRRHSILSLIDAAHGIGQIPLHLSELDPDFLVTNCHKWLLTPRGCALLYVPLRNHRLMRSTLPTSHGFVADERLPRWWDIPVDDGPSNFASNFAFVGAADSSAYLCVRPALDWRRRLAFGALRGEEAIYEYLQVLARRAGEVVTSALPGSMVLENEERTLGRCAFSVVRLPLDTKLLTGGEKTLALRIWSWMKETCVRDYNTHFQFSFWQDAFWVRLSAQVYLDERDFVWAGERLRELCGRVAKGEWKNSQIKNIL